MTAISTSRSRAPDGVARLLAGMQANGTPARLADHLRAYGPLGRQGGSLIQAVQASGLTGRGGSGFPCGDKLAAVAAGGGRPVVVVNATEGEPASKKDRALVRLVPHLVLDGAAAAADAIGARQIVVAVARGARAEHASLVAALGERADGRDWRVAAIEDGFVSGEESALMNALAGRPAKPSLKPPYPFQRGVDGQPTLVQNAETLAHVALVARFGPAWFRSLGTTVAPGTALVTLSGAVARPGVYEIELGTRISELLAEAGGVTEPVDAFLVGGYFGGWTRDLRRPLTRDSGLGAGVVVAFPASGCGLCESARVARYLAAETAGQCGPCVHGLAALADGLEQVARGRNRDAGARLARWAEQVTGRGACRHPDGAAGFVTSSLAAFEQEVRDHLRDGRCRAGDRGVLPGAPR